MLCCRIVNGIKKQKHKKQPWSNVECFAFGVGIVWLAAWKLVSNAAQSHNPSAKCEAFHVAPRLFFMFLFFYSIDDSATKHNLSPHIFH